MFYLNRVKTYIDINKKRPALSSKYKDINHIVGWIGNSQKNYSKKQYNMKDETIYKLWTEFISNDKYKKYFK